LNGQEWKIHSLDIKAAFLQGSSIERAVHLLPPPEAHTSKLWQLNIPVYGLCDAPRAGWPLKLQCKIPVHSSTFSSTYFSFQVPQMTDYQYINQNLSSFKKKIPVFSSTRI